MIGLEKQLVLLFCRYSNSCCAKALLRYHTACAIVKNHSFRKNIKKNFSSKNQTRKQKLDFFWLKVSHFRDSENKKLVLMKKCSRQLCEKLLPIQRSITHIPIFWHFRFVKISKKKRKENMKKEDMERNQLVQNHNY